MLLVVEISVQLVPLSLVYSQRVSASLPPVSDEAICSLPLPMFVVTVGLAGLAGLVRKLSLASSVEQPLSLYAFHV